MSKFVMIVDLEVKPEHVDAFVAAANGQAETSLRVEPGCHQFDIVRSPEDKTKIRHYEVFEDAAAFEAHAQSAHTRDFAGKIQPMLLATQIWKGELLASRKK